MTHDTPTHAGETAEDEPVIMPPGTLRARIGARPVILIGMMGAGKSAIGRRLARSLELPFIDSDTEIEKAAGMSIPDIFARHGEAYFRAGEARVMSRLLEGGACVLATGGGAWVNPETRALAHKRGISIWLDADLDTLMKRVRRRSSRPLLKTPDPEGTLRSLLQQRAPLYAEADIVVPSRDVAHELMVHDTLAALDAWLSHTDSSDTNA